MSGGGARRQACCCRRRSGGGTRPPDCDPNFVCPSAVKIYGSFSQGCISGECCDYYEQPGGFEIIASDAGGDGHLNCRYVGRTPSKSHAIIGICHGGGDCYPSAGSVLGYIRASIQVGACARGEFEFIAEEGGGVNHAAPYASFLRWDGVCGDCGMQTVRPGELQWLQSKKPKLQSLNFENPWLGSECCGFDTTGAILGGGPYCWGGPNSTDPGCSKCSDGGNAMGSADMYAA